MCYPATTRTYNYTRLVAVEFQLHVSSDGKIRWNATTFDVALSTIHVSRRGLGADKHTETMKCVPDSVS
jgi:hypothetical protein